MSAHPSETWTLRYDAKPVTMNAARKGGGDHWSQRAAATREWRDTFAVLARAENMPKLAWFTVTVQHYCHRGPLADIGACMPSVKAAIDGIVDARIVPDDSPEYLKGILFLPPERAKQVGLALIIAGEIATKPTITAPPPPKRPKLRLITNEGES